MKRIVSVLTVLVVFISFFNVNSSIVSAQQPLKVNHSRLGSASNSTMIVKDDGTVWEWSNRNDEGKLILTQINGLSNIISVSADAYNTAALKKDGTVWAWSNYDEKKVPVQAKGLTNITSISVGRGKIVALKNDGTVWVWSFHYDQLEDYSDKPASNPIQIKGITDATEVFSFIDAAALKKDGTFWRWGTEGTYIEKNTDSNTLVQVKDMNSVIQISSSVYNTFALKKDGTVWNWGYNPDGELGNLRTNFTASQKVDSLTDIISITSGYSNTLALKKDGTVWMWDYKIEPKQLEGLKDIALLSTNGVQIVAVKNDSTVWSVDRWNGNTVQIPIKITPNIQTLTTPQNSGSSNEIIVTIKGSPLQMDVNPIIENGRTLVPLRAIFEALDAKIDWNNTSQTVTATKGDTIVNLQIGNPVANVNGKKITLDVPAKIVGGRTLVPARFVAEALGAKVEWDDKNRTVIIR